MIQSIDVPFPRKVQRLIHLELSRARYQIVLCQACGLTHFRWFKKSVYEMKSVMNTWKAVFDKDLGLYEKTGKFSSDWGESIENTSHDLTAKRLIDICYCSQRKSHKHT